jgi:hypothetical protein
MGWMVRRSNPGRGGQDFLRLSRLALELTQPYIDSGYTVIPGGKEARVCDYHSPRYSAKIKERVELYLLLLCAFMACSRVNFTSFILHISPLKCVLSSENSKEPKGPISRDGLFVPPV